MLTLLLALAAPPLDPIATRLVAIPQFPRESLSWPIAAPGASAGDVVRLSLDDRLFDGTAAAIDRVRPVIGTFAVPYVFDEQPLEPVSPDPEAVLQPAAGGGAVITVTLPQVPATLTRLALSAHAAAPFTATVRVAWRSPVARPAPPPPVAWRCTGFPCALELPLDPADMADVLTLTIAAPAPQDLALDGVRLWRRRAALVFAWPADAPPRLASGFPVLPAGDPRVVRVREALAGRPALAASIDFDRVASDRARIARASRLALITTAVVLLLTIAAFVFRPRR